MQQRLIGKLSRNLRSLVRGADDLVAPCNLEIATLRLKECVTDEWQRRQNGNTDHTFDLPQLLSSLHRSAIKAQDVSQTAHYRSGPRCLPDRGVRRDGRVFKLDDTFFARRQYEVDELSSFADGVFVEIAYRCLLKRSSDPGGFSGFLQALRNGVRDRVDVLNALRSSPEGTHQSVAIQGLRLQLFWRRAESVPYVGAVVGWLRALSDVGRTARRLRMLEAIAEETFQNMSGRLDELAESEMQGNRKAILALEKSQVQIETAVIGLADRYRRFLAEFEMRDAARAGHDQPATSADPAVDQPRARH